MFMFLLKYDELGLKSRQSQKRLFSLLLKNIEKMGGWAYFRENRLFAEGDKNKLAKVFGITQVWDVYQAEKDLREIADIIAKHSEDKTYKIEVKRVDKNFPGNSIEIAQELAKLVGEKGVKLGVQSYDEEILVEIRHHKAFVLMNPVKGPGGLPYGSQGKVLMMFSGGLDSPVASWMLARRGAQLDYFYFSTCKCMHRDVKEVWEFLKGTWGMDGTLYYVDGTEIIKELLLNVPPKYRMVIFKRVLYRIAERLANEIGALFLGTGESLGQVSTQTLGNLFVIDKAIEKSVLRPLIGFNKQEIIDKAREIGTYNLSIKVKERCSITSGKVAINAREDKILELEEKLSKWKEVEFKEVTDEIKVCD